MNRPTDPTLQCPSCHLQSLGPVCGAARRRINKNEKDEYFKAIDCTLWTERKIVTDAVGIRKCPTCGKVIPEALTPEKLLKQVREVFPDSTMVAADVVSDPFMDAMDLPGLANEFLSTSRPARLDSDLEWDIPVASDQQDIPKIQDKINAEVGVTTLQLFPEQILPVEAPRPKKQKRRSGDMPKARISASRRKRMEAANVVVPDPTIG